MSDPPLPWERPGWLEQAGTWIRAELARWGLAVIGAPERVSASRWALVLRVPASAGNVYFKAIVPLPAHEPALTQALARWHPDCVPRVLAADAQHGWLLMPDEGVRLREVLQSDLDVRHWRRVLPRYATLQMDLASRLDDLLALGVPDRRPATLPEGCARLLDDAGALRVGQSLGLTAEEHRRLRRLVPRFAALCAVLAGDGLPPTLHHGDLHDGNILLQVGRYVLFDWGNACVAHPFVSLRTALKSAKYTFGWDDDAPELTRLRDRYLEPWTRYASHRRLVATLDVAHRVGMVSNALTWQHILAGSGGLLAEGVDAPVPRLLREFLAAETDATNAAHEGTGQR